MKEELRLEEGRALCMWNDAGWGAMVATGRRDGHFDDRLITATVEMIRRVGTVADADVGHVRAVVACALGLVPLLAHRISRTHSGCRSFLSSSKSSRHAAAEADEEPGAPGVERARRVPSDRRIRCREPVFLVDDLVDTKWTLTEVGVLLRGAGSGPVVPLVLGSSMGRDS